MKLLLTSGGVTNPSIRDALVDLLGKPIADSSALCIPTAMYGHPMAGPGAKAWQFISGNSENPMVDLGWESVGVLELTALPSIDEERWVPLVRETDVLLVAGGDALYLCHWMRQCGLADLLPSLSETVWVGLSAGSMVMTPRIGEDFVQWRPPTGDDSTLGIVDFSICPHLAQEDMPGNSMAEAEQWAAGISGPAYAMDDKRPSRWSTAPSRSCRKGTGSTFPRTCRRQPRVSEAPSKPLSARTCADEWSSGPPAVSGRFRRPSFAPLGRVWPERVSRCEASGRLAAFGRSGGPPDFPCRRGRAGPFPSSSRCRWPRAGHRSGRPRTRCRLRR